MKKEKFKKRNSLPTWLQMTMHIWIWKFEYEKIKLKKRNSLQSNVFFLRRWNIERRTLNVERPYILLFFLHLMKADIVGYVI